MGDDVAYKLKRLLFFSFCFSTLDMTTEVLAMYRIHSNSRPCPCKCPPAYPSYFEVKKHKIINRLPVHVYFSKLKYQAQYDWQ